VWVYTVTDENSDPLDSSVFTLSLAGKTLSIQTSDPNKIGTYTVLVEATQGVYAAQKIQKQFVVTVTDLC